MEPVLFGQSGSIGNQFIRKPVYIAYRKIYQFSIQHQADQKQDCVKDKADQLFGNQRPAYNNIINNAGEHIGRTVNQVINDIANERCPAKLYKTMLYRGELYRGKDREHQIIGNEEQ
jgi:hypothetical protein